MAEFIEQRSLLNTARNLQSTAGQEVFALSERMKLVDQEIASLKRQANPNNPVNQKKLAALQEKRNSLERQQEEKKSRFNSLTADLTGIVKEYGALTDPKLQLPLHFNSNTPFLLLPTRMETRFKTITNPQTGAQQKQLWVRVYPDTCMVDTFDPQLSPQELRNAARFWAEYYAAGAIVDPTNPDPQTLTLQKAAWAFLVRAEGSGRAAWIAQAEEAKPQPGSVFPKRNSDKTIILTIATEDTSIVANQAAIFSFFKNLWLAGKDEQKINIAKASLPDAADTITKFLPVNFNDPLPTGLKREEADVQIALVLLKSSLDSAGKTSAWSQGAHVSIGPERFVLLGYKNNLLVIEQTGNLIPSPLPVGFNPNAAEENNFKPTEDGNLEIPEDVQWIVDFDQAVANGMGFRVNLSPAAENGVDRLFAIGIRLSADESSKGGQQLLSELFDHHYYSSKGFSLIPQGTPTNNTDTSAAGSSGINEADKTFEPYFNKTASFTHSADWQKKQDGQWLAEWLGLPEEGFKKVLNADGLDQADALNMNLALWPGTLGYAMDAMMKPVFSTAVTDTTQQFFSMFVSGRGTLPAIKIGNQPYGILPATAFKRQQWMNVRVPGIAVGGNPLLFAGAAAIQPAYLRKLYDILLKIRSDWQTALLPKVAHVSAEKPDSSHQQLLDVLGLHPNSVEFHKRYLQTLDMLFSYAYFIFPSVQGQAAFDKMEFGRAYQLLKDLGYTPDDKKAGELPLLSKLYGLDDNWEHKVIIDTVPLSETKELRAYTADGKNYITALLTAATKSMEALRKQEGLSENPTALLFSFLKFALEQGYFDTAVRLHEISKVFAPAQANFARTEQPYVHMTLDNTLVESRYAVLYKTDDRIASNITVADRVSELIKQPLELKTISPGHAQQMEALKHLETASTARLERAFVEHLDCCSYRLDAWQQAMTKLQLTLMRNNPSNTNPEQQTPPRQGIYIGAYGWLENVVPDKKKVLTPKRLDAELQKDFKDSYVTDAENAGFIHAPSVNQAVTAAVLRNAFLTNGKTDNNSAFAINLSSERIRLALGVIEGIQNGQPLPALLGYKFERMLHDQPALVNKGVDRYIYALRKRFPLNANRIADTKVETDTSLDPETVPITAIEARNVVHGKKLVDHVRKQVGVNKTYPFGFSTTQLPTAVDPIKSALTEAVNFIMNIEDAIADLGMAESVHQVCMGNYDRAAGVLESYSNGNYPQTPDVIRTPRSAPTLTHRVGLQIDFIASVAHDPLHPRRSAEPSLNSWLLTMLPPMNTIVCSFTHTDRTTNTATPDSVTIAQLGLSAIDLLYLLNTEGKAALSELDEVVLDYVYQHKPTRLDTDISLEYIKRPADTTKFSLFEVMSLVKSLRALVLQSASLKPTDVSMPRETSVQDPLTITLPRARVDDAIAALNNKLDNDFKPQILDILNALPASPTALEAASILQQADTYLTALIDQLRGFNRYGLPETATGDLYRFRQDTLIRLRKKIEAIIERFEKNKLAYEGLEASFNPAAPDAIALLQKMEALVSTKYSKLDEINLLDVQNRKSLFDAKLLNLKGLVVPAAISGISAFVNSIKPVTANLADFDLEPFSLEEEEQSIVRWVLDQLKPKAKSFYTLGKKATQAAADALQDFATLTPDAQVKQVEAAAKALFGDEFKMLPRYELDGQQQFEISNSWMSNDLLHYVKNVHAPLYLEPEEDWLHGAARVREKLHHAENCLLLREALGLDETAFNMHPVQLPYKDADYHWLALPFPEGIKLEGDALLYTAFTQATASSPQYTCGLLIDEWTEIIPLEKETTGLSFHYDRPNAEAPQTMLLVTPASMEGNWQWQDIIDALHDTLDMAKLRAVEPYHIDQTLYARYLPPLVSPTTRYPITIGMYLSDLKLALPVQ